MPLFKRKKSTNPQFDATYAKFKELEAFAKQLRLDLTTQMDTVKQMQAAGQRTVRSVVEFYNDEGAMNTASGREVLGVVSAYKDVHAKLDGDVPTQMLGIFEAQVLAPLDAWLAAFGSVHARLPELDAAHQMYDHYQKKVDSMRASREQAASQRFVRMPC